MAVVVVPDDLDLVIEPHELTQEDRDAFSKAVQESRQQQDSSEMTQRALKILNSRANPRESQ